MEGEEPNSIRGVIWQNLVRLSNRIALACERSGRLVSEVRLIAITKNFPSSWIRAAYRCGLHNFGENRVKETRLKYAELTDIRHDMQLNLVGHLQSNKARDAVELFDIIQSVDSIKLAGIINERAGRPVSIMLQVNAAGEMTKYGFSHDEVGRALEEIYKMPMIQVIGLMTIAPIAGDPEVVRPVFSNLRKIKESFGLQELSMGMTDDFEVAIEEGSTAIRIGRAIFGERRIQ